MTLRDHVLACPRCAARVMAETGARCSADGAFLVAPREIARSHGNPLLGALLAGRFGLVEILGFGTQTAVYRAWDVAQGTGAAVKVLRLEGVDDRLVAALDRDAEASHELDGVEGVPRLRLLFDAREGPAALRALARDLAEPVPSPTTKDARRWARTLRAVHARGRVHGDLAPGHLLGGAIIDWGASQRLDQAGPSLGLHPRYASPEVLAGGNTTPSADWFAFARSLHALAPDVGEALAREGLTDTEPSRREAAAARWISQADPA